MATERCEECNSQGAVIKFEKWRQIIGAAILTGWHGGFFRCTDCNGTGRVEVKG